MGRQLRAYLGRHWPMSRVRELVDAAPEKQVALRREGTGDEMGLRGLLVPSSLGGLGAGQVELGLVCEELGYALYPGPAFGTVAMAVNALLVLADGPARDELLRRIVDGATVAVAAFDQADGWVANGAALRAEQGPSGWTLTGTKTLVVDGVSADVVLALAATGDTLRLFSVERGAAGLTATALDVLDPTREIAQVEFRGTPAQPLSGDVGASVDAFLDRARLALAAEQVGVADRCLTMSTEYAKVRTQFNRPIGSFQAVKHMCADMLVAVQTARDAVRYAAWSLDMDRPEAARAVCIAAAHAAETGQRVAADTIQVHGGMGFTWECDAHFYYKRATANAVLFGDADHHYQRLADLLERDLDEER